MKSQKSTSSYASGLSLLGGPLQKNFDINSSLMKTDSFMTTYEGSNCMYFLSSFWTLC